VYKLSNQFATNNFTVTVVGCGGTGGFVADGLCRVLPSRADLVLVDHDVVEERNLIRQNFSIDDLSKYKSEALAQRLASRYRRPVAYSVLPIGMLEIRLPGLVIGCVDNGLARRDIAKKVKHSLVPPYGFISWWIDAGNGQNYGQVVVGNHPEVAYFEEDKCLALPMPTVQRPELLSQAPAPTPGCAQIEQGPTINQAIATVVVEVARRLIEGSCTWMQLYLDLEAGTLHPVYAAPESLRGILKKNKVRKEVKHGH